MNDENEDLTVSMPAGFAGVSENSGRTGVKMTELVKSRKWKAQTKNAEAGWLRWLVIGGAGLLVIGIIVAITGIMGLMIALNILAVSILAGIFIRLGNRRR